MSAKMSLVFFALFAVLFWGCQSVPVEKAETPSPVPSRAEAPSPEKKAPPKALTLTLKVQQAPTDIRAMGFEIWFDPTVVAFVKYERLDLFTQGFSIFGSNVVRPGKLRMGGLESGQSPITQGVSGELLTLHFKVLKDGNPNFKFMNLKDDLKGWRTRASSCLEKDIFSGIMLCKDRPL